MPGCENRVYVADCLLGKEQMGGMLSVPPRATCSIKLTAELKVSLVLFKAFVVMRSPARPCPGKYKVDSSTFAGLKNGSGLPLEQVSDYLAPNLAYVLSQSARLI